MPEVPRGFRIVVTQRADLPLDALRDRPLFQMRRIGWNDAGYYTTYDVFLHRRGQPVVEAGYLKVMQLGMRVDEYVLPLGQIETLPARTFALGQSFTFYESLVQADAGLAADFLRALNDVVVVPRSLQEIQNDRVFKASLIRESRAVRALEDAPQLFSPSSAQRTSRLPKQLTISVPLGHGSVSFDCDFSPLLENVPNRLLALVGDNGTGKSATLSALIGAAARENNLSRRSNAGSIQDRSGQQVKFARTILIAYGAFDEHPLPKRDVGLMGEGDLSLARAKTEYFYRGLRRESVSGRPIALKGKQELEEELGSALASIRDSRRVDALESAISDLSQVTQFPSDVLRALYDRDRPLVTDDLSSGQVVILNILVSLVAYLEPGSLVLIDEPEVHLHPPLISALMRGIAGSLEVFDSIAVIATHSSVVIQELPRRNVRVFSRVDGYAAVAQPTIETFGEALGVIDSNVFGMSGVVPNAHRALEALAEMPVEWAAEVLGGSLSDQSLAILLQLQSGRLNG